MNLSMNIMFGGNCKEAVIFYCDVFNQELPRFTTYGESDTSFDPNVQNSDKAKELIMNASVNICGTSVIFNDMPDNFEFSRGNGFGITLKFDDANIAKEIFDNLSKGGQVFVPFAEIKDQGFYGMLGDKFNIMWTIVC